MQLYYLAQQAAFKDPYGDDWVARLVEQGIPTAVLGMIAIFAVLSLIWGCLELFRYFFYKDPNKKVKEENKETKEETVSAPVTEEVEETTEYADDEEIVAAIIAAITAMRSEENEAVPVGFRVVSFRRKR